MRERVTAVGEATSLADRKRRAGQRLLIGIPGPHIDDATRALILELRPAGFVLFKRNVVEPAQVRELNRELASLVDAETPAIRAVDQEGGRVQRVRAPATEWPAMRVVGQAEVETAEVAAALARELRAMEFDLDFAPVADVDSNPKNPVIGDRSFGRDAAAVSAHVATFVKAMQAEHIIACAKHFPGHGDTSVDSHLDLPVVERDEPDLRHVELPPFRAAVEAGVGTLMSSHVVYPAWDDAWPATLSERVIPQLLRKELGFDGVIFSDDLEMKALRGRYPTDEQVRRATLAGIDVLLACERQDLQVELFEALVRAQEEDPSGHEKRAIASVRRVQELRLRFYRGRPPAPPLSIVGIDAHKRLADRVRARGGIA